MSIVRKGIIAAAAAAVVATAGAAAQARDLTIVSWGDAYQAAQGRIYFKPFSEQASVPVIDVPWNGGIGVLRAKVQGGASDWDVVQVESEELELGCEEGVFEELDWAKIGGKDAYLPAAVHDCGVGAIVYNFVIGYDKDKLSDAPNGWADFFDTQKYPGKRALRKGPKTTLEAALMADGVPAAEVYSVLGTDEGIERAFKKLDTIRGDLIFWESGAQPPQLLASGEVTMTSVYNGRIDAANKNDNRNFGMVWDGSLFTVDSWVILKDSPNLEQAYKFLAFAGTPDAQAQLPLEIAYGVTNKDAIKKIPEERAKDLPTYEANMANAIQISDAFWLENIDRLTERFNKWAATQ